MTISLSSLSNFSTPISSGSGKMNSHSPYDLTQLIRAIAEPRSEHGVEKDVLAELLGLGQDPKDLGKMKEYARRKVQQEFLQPVKDLEDEYIGHWQM
jgi:hypothetical protein